MHDHASVAPRWALDRREANLAAHAAAFVVLLAMGLAVYWPIFDIIPARGDNFYVLAWVHSAPFDALLELDPAIYPEWRPLAYLTIWLEHRLVPVEWAAIHHGINLLWWVACAWLVYRLVYVLAGGAWSGLIAGALLLLDRRAHASLYWIVERQTSMACVFGLLGFVLLARAGAAPLTRRQSVALTLLLLASALSKEYGLAFALALAVYALWHRRRDLAAPALATLGAYGVLRVVLADGAWARYCEEMGFGHDLIMQCMDYGSGRTWQQSIYNVIVATVGIPLRGLISEMGRLMVDPGRLAAGAFLTTIALLGFSAGPRLAGLLAMLPLFNAVLSFMIYRERNALVGAAGLAVLVGVGLARWPQLVAASRPRRALYAAALVVLLALVVRQGVHSHRLIAHEASHWYEGDPCRSRFRAFEYGRRFAPVVRDAFEMGDPRCHGTQ